MKSYIISWYVVVVTGFVIVARRVTECGKGSLSVSVFRRYGGDIFETINSSGLPHACHDDNNLTYLVSEEQCVKNQELLHGNIKRYRFHDTELSTSIVSQLPSILQSKVNTCIVYPCIYVVTS